MTDNKNNKVYILTIEYNSETEEIEYIAEEIIDNKDVATHIYGEMDFDTLDFDVEMLEYIRDHYTSGQS